MILYDTVLKTQLYSSVQGRSTHELPRLYHMIRSIRITLSCVPEIVIRTKLSPDLQSTL